jgi:hypothetical protein
MSREMGMATNKSKTTRKGASAGEPSNYSKLYKSSAAGVAPAPEKSAVKVEKRSDAVAVPAAAPAAAAKDTVDWRGEYGYVLSDLRRLGLVTLGLVVAIIVAGFFL